MTSFYVFYLTRFCDFATCTLSWIQNKRSKFTSKSFWNKIARWIVTQWRRDGGTKKSVFWIDTLVYFTFFQRLSADPLSTFSQHKMTTKLSFSNSLHSPPLSLSKCRFFHSRILQTHFHTHGASCKEACSYKPSSLSLSLSLLLSHSLISDARPRRGSPSLSLSLSLSFLLFVIYFIAS